MRSCATTQGLTATAVAAEVHCEGRVACWILDVVALGSSGREIDYATAHKSSEKGGCNEEEDGRLHRRTVALFLCTSASLLYAHSWAGKLSSATKFRFGAEAVAYDNHKIYTGGSILDRISKVRISKWMRSSSYIQSIIPSFFSSRRCEKVSSLSTDVNLS